MIEMLETFDGYCLSKMMLRAFPEMVSNGSELIIQYFESCSY